MTDLDAALIGALAGTAYAIGLSVGRLRAVQALSADLLKKGYILIIGKGFVDIIKKGES